MVSRDRTRLPPTKVIGKSYMTRGMIEDLERRGVLGVGMARPPPEGEIEAKPNHDEVIVFRDFFIAGLHFPLDPMVVEIFKLFDVYTHQMTPTSFVRLNLYMWLSKTYKLKPSATGFARLFRCHYQPKMVFVKPSEDAEATEADPQFGIYTFAFHTQLPSPVVAYRNRWGAWQTMWFYHKVPLEGPSGTHPLVVKEIGFLPEQPPSVEVDEGTEEAKAHIAMLREVSKLFLTRDIVEEYVACKCFPVREGWSITSWAGREKHLGGLPMPNFSTSFGITKEG